MPSIGELPTEILLKIFKLNTVQDLCHPHDPFQTTISSSRVCGRWRSITTHSPWLWTETFDLSYTVNFLSRHTLPLCGGGSIDTLVLPSITKTFLGDPQIQKRARRNGVLSIAETLASRSFAPPCQVNTKLTTLIPKLIKKTRKLILKPPSSSWSLLETLFSQDISHLEQLVLVKDTDELPDHRTECTSTTLNCALKQASSAWSLRSLHLRGCCLVFRPNLAFSNLENLVIREVPTVMARSPRQLLEAVSWMPKLKHLELVGASFTSEFYIHGDAEIFEPFDEVIKLSNLEYFYFDGPISHCTNIFTALDIPLSCSVTCLCDEISSTGTGSPLYRLLASLEPRLDKDGYLGESIIIDVSTGTCGLWAVKPSLPWDQNKGKQDMLKPSFLIRFYWDEDLELSTSLHPEPIIQPLSVLRAVCNVAHGSFAKVTELDLRVEVQPYMKPEAHREVLIALLLPLINLQHLDQISCQTFQFLLPYFDWTLNQYSPNPSSYPDQLQFLKSISFVEMDFRHRYPSLHGPRLQNILLNYVSNRLTDDNLVPIGNFTLLDCKACISAEFERYGVKITKVAGTMYMGP